jgi:hypothetical protein
MPEELFYFAMEGTAGSSVRSEWQFRRIASNIDSAVRAGLKPPCTMFPLFP